MIGTCGNENDSDCIVTVDLNFQNGIEIEVSSKLKYMFGELMKKAIYEILEELQVKNAKITLQDFGALDFIIKARTKTAVKLALRGGTL